MSLEGLGALWCHHFKACLLPLLLLPGDGGGLQELTHGGNLASSEGWDPQLSWTVLGGGFFNFLKILPPFVKGDRGGEEETDTWLGEGGVHCHVCSLFSFS